MAQSGPQVRRSKSLDSSDTMTAAANSAETMTTAANSSGGAVQTVYLDEAVEATYGEENDGSSEAAGVFCGFLTGKSDNEQQNLGASQSNQIAIQLSKTTPATEVGKKLAQISKVAEEQFGEELDSLASTFVLKTPSESLFNSFKIIVKRILTNTNVNWGRIVALLCFGYRLAVHCVTHTIKDFFVHLVGAVVQYMVSEKILQWVRQHGGWHGALSFFAESTVSKVREMLGHPVVAVLAVGVAVFVVWRLQSRS